MCSKHGMQEHFKGGRTVKKLLIAPNDKDTITQKSGVIYRFSSDRVDVDNEYIGESARTLRVRFK